MCNSCVFLHTQNAHTWVFLPIIQIVGDIWNYLNKYSWRESINRPSTPHNTRHRFRYVYSQADRLYELQNRVDYRLKMVAFQNALLLSGLVLPALSLVLPRNESACTSYSKLMSEYMPIM